jgi:hypothetical protein
MIYGVIFGTLTLRQMSENSVFLSIVLFAILWLALSCMLFTVTGNNRDVPASSGQSFCAPASNYSTEPRESTDTNSPYPYSPASCLDEEVDNTSLKSDDEGRSQTSSRRKSNHGFFDTFSSASYSAYLQGLSDAELKKKEISKIQADYRGQMGVTGGTMHAIATCGLSLHNVIISGRKLYLANKKLPLVREEMRRRGLELHVENGDVWKAAATSLPSVMFGVPDWRA